MGNTMAIGLECQTYWGISNRMGVRCPHGHIFKMSSLERKRTLATLEGEQPSDPRFDKRGKLLHENYWHSMITLKMPDDYRKQMRSVHENNNTYEPDKEASNPLWNLMVKGTQCRWLSFGNEKGPNNTLILDRVKTKEYLGKMNTPVVDGVSLMQYAQSHSDTKKITGDIGEFFIFMMLKDYMKTLTDFKGKHQSNPRIVEDRAVTDCSFIRDGIFVHVCVKASYKQSKALSSKAFWHVVTNDWKQPYMTLVLRCRVHFVDINHPMGPKCYIQLFIKRNFNR